MNVNPYRVVGPMDRRRLKDRRTQRHPGGIPRRLEEYRAWLRVRRLWGAWL